MEKVDFQNKKIIAQSKQMEAQSKQMESQSKRIQSQSKQIEKMEQRINGITGEFQLFKTVFKDLYSNGTTKDLFFTSPPHIAREDVADTQLF